MEADSLRKWQLLARKLSTSGANVTIVAFGGSVTVGCLVYEQALKNTLEGGWVEQLVTWLKAAVPSVTFNVINATRSSSDVIVAATCWYQHVPQDADLVLVEYSLNGCCGTFGKPMCSSATMPRVRAAAERQVLATDQQQQQQQQQQRCRQQ